MYINMALQTVREFLEYHLTVRLTMAFLALRNVFMLGMVAFCAGYLSVLAGSSFYLVINRRMTSSAYFILYRISITDLERRVYGMTGQSNL